MQSLFIQELTLRRELFFYVIQILQSLENRPSLRFSRTRDWKIENIRGTQREYSSKPLKHSIVKRILVFKR